MPRGLPGGGMGGFGIDRYIMAISEIRACFTFSLDKNGDILTLIEIIFD